MYKIIRVNREHIKQLAEIDFESEHQMEKDRTFGSYKKELIRRFNKKHEIFFGYKENGELKGYASLKLFFPGHRHCEMYWLAVKRKYQGAGIGTTLIKFMEAYVKKKGFRAAFFYTNEKMGKVRKFYEKLGYKFISKFPEYYNYSKNNTAVLYGKRL